MGYRVEWSVIVEDAQDKIDAAKQAWAMMDDATTNNTGTTVLFVSDEYGDDKTLIDMEEIMNVQFPTN